VIRALRQLGHPGGVSAEGPDSWRPWRSYAVHHLWATLETLEAVDTREHS
jgi:3-methyladenine DNA glycosylase/8-oxoguanine DNA glycosylase